MLTDLRLATLALRRQPAFAAGCVSLLTLCLGSALALFALLDATLFRPLPVDRGGLVWTLGTALEDGSFSVGLVSDADLAQINAMSGAIEAAAGASVDEDSLVRPRGESLSVLTASVTAGYFSVFDTPLHIGRGFELTEHARPASPRLAVLSHWLWRTAFESDPGVLGRTIQLGEQRDVRVVGVASADFDLPRGADLWLNARSVPGRPDTSSSFEGFIRIRSDTSPTLVREQVNAALATAERPYNPVAVSRPPRSRQGILVPLRDALLGESKSIIILASSASVLVLLLGAINVATLLLMRRVVRHRQVAVHLALGATEARVLRQTAFEAGLLAGTGLIGGLLIAFPTLDLVIWLAGPFVPGIGLALLDGSMLLTGSALLALTVLVVVVPASLRAAMHSSRRTAVWAVASAPSPRSPLIGSLIGVGVALTVVGAVAASWLVSGYRSLAGTDPGFRTSRGLIADVQLPGSMYGTADAATWFADTTASLGAVPGVRKVGLAVTSPLGGEREFTRSVAITSSTGSPAGAARFRYVGPGFFEAAGIRILEGHDFHAQATTGTVSGVVVNRTFAERYLADSPWLGARITFLGLQRTYPDGLSVIGVVEAARYWSLGNESEPVVYLSSSEWRGVRYRQSFLIDADVTQTDRLAPVIRQHLTEAEPLAAVTVERMTDRVSRQLAPRRVGMNGMIGFAGAALVVGTLGAYALATLGAARRRREIAVRSALGGSRAALVLLLLKRVGAPALTGIATGLLVSLLIDHTLRTRALLVAEPEPLSALAAVAVVMVAVLAATLLPAMRVTAADVPTLLRE